MLQSPRRPVECIFCAFRTYTRIANFCKSSQVRRYAGSHLRHGPVNRAHSPEENGTAFRRIHKTRHATKYDGASRPKQSAVTNDGSLEIKAFRPAKGETFDRKAPSRPKRDRQQAEKQKLAIKLRVAALEEQLHSDAALQKLELDHSALETQFERFKDQLFQSQDRKSSKSSDRTALSSLLRINADEDAEAFDLHLKYAFYGFVASKKFSTLEIQNQDKLLNFSHPAEWYPRARQIQRQIHVHVGPTNSGKTYQALKKLEQAETGCYAGPLRLLAHEIFERLNAQGLNCNLITGDDRRNASVEGTQTRSKVACTVEMVPLREQFDVMVIDEIQMLGSVDRGWAWTQAFLGAIAKEVHVCGEKRTVPIIKMLAAACGDTVHVHEYERLSPLEMMPKSLGGNLRNLKKGDCIVGFSILILHSLKSLIEKITKKKCAIIYGTLPPETRAQQAKLFNDPDNDYDYLVATNAVGMGLNLSIRRLVFQSAYQNVKGSYTALAAADIKQIAGRAGRYSTAAADMRKTKAAATLTNATADATPPSDSNKRPPGLVTSLEELDYPIIERAMEYEPEPLPTAGILPTALIVEHFARYFPAETPFSYLLIQMKEIARLSPQLHFCLFQSNILIADALESIPGLRLVDRYVFCLAPFDMRRKGEQQLVQAYARLVVGNKGATILEIDELEMDLLDEGLALNRHHLRALEQLHKGIITFMWLSFKFPQIFLDRDQALFVKALVEEQIDKTLSTMAFDYDQAQRAREQAIMDLLKSDEDKPDDPHDKSNGDSLNAEDDIVNKNLVTPRANDMSNPECGDVNSEASSSHVVEPPVIEGHQSAAVG